MSNNEAENINAERAEKILNSIMAFARLDFDKTVEIDEPYDTMSAIASGVNMLGEELRTKVVSLQEKETLIKEIHHRVKNNLQIIISMIKLQAPDDHDPVISKFVDDCVNRINAIALVHELLYSSKGLISTNLKEYNYFLLRSLFLSFAPSKHEIEYQMDISESINVDIDRIIPLGLMLNEMITNSLKHAFPAKKGLINITAQKDDHWISVMYKDNGIGLPAGYDLNNEEGLGSQLIVLLADQLDAELIHENDPGLKYTVKIPL